MKRVFIIYGSTSTLGQALIKLIPESNDIYVFNRSIVSNDRSKSFLLSDVDGFKSVISKIDVEINIFYLSAVKGPQACIEDFIEINIKRPIAIYDMVKGLSNVNYAYIGSQGDFHASVGDNFYNASKSFSSIFFEGASYLRQEKCHLCIIRPWLFQSQSTNRGGLLNVDVDDMARYVLKKFNTKNIINYPSMTYFCVRVLHLVFPSVLYKLLNKLR